MENEQKERIFVGFLKIDKHLDIGEFSSNKPSFSLHNMAPGHYYCFARKTAATGNIHELEIKHESNLSETRYNKTLEQECIPANNTIMLYLLSENQNTQDTINLANRELRKLIEHWGLKKGQVKCFQNQYMVACSKENNMKYRCQIYINAEDEITSVKIVQPANIKGI